MSCTEKFYNSCKTNTVRVVPTTRMRESLFRARVSLLSSLVRDILRRTSQDDFLGAYEIQFLDARTHWVLTILKDWKSEGHRVVKRTSVSSLTEKELTSVQRDEILVDLVTEAYEFLDCKDELVLQALQTRILNTPHRYTFSPKCRDTLSVDVQDAGTEWQLTIKEQNHRNNQDMVETQRVSKRASVAHLPPWELSQRQTDEIVIDGISQGLLNKKRMQPLLTSSDRYLTVPTCRFAGKPFRN